MLHYTETLGIEDFNDVYQALCDAKRKWKNIGIYLSMKINDLDNIEDDRKTNDKCLQEMVSQWLKAVKTHEPSWEKLVQALLLLKEEGLACDIETKHIKPHRVGAPVMAATRQDDTLGMLLPI